MADGSRYRYAKSGNGYAKLTEAPRQGPLDVLDHVAAEFADAVQRVCRTADRVHSAAADGNGRLERQQERLHASMNALEANVRPW